MMTEAAVATPETPKSADGQDKKLRWYPRGAWLWGSAVLFVVLGALALWALPGWLLNVWVPSGRSSDKRLLLGTATQIVLLGLGGVIAVVGVALSIARHGQELESSRRDERRHALELQKETARRGEILTQQQFESNREAQRSGELAIQRRIDSERELRSRFVSAVELLSADAAIKRTAGLYALAALADDWSAHGRTDEVQVCIDVLCGYLRAEASLDQSEAGVRRAGYDLIRSHLRGTDDDVPWLGRTFDLTSAPIWFDVDLSEIRCTGETRILLEGSTVSGGASLDFSRVRVSGGAKISLAKAKLEAKSIILLARSVIRDGGVVSLFEARLGEGVILALSKLEVIDGGILDLFSIEARDSASLTCRAMAVERSGQVRLQQSELGQGTFLDLEAATIRDGGELLFAWSTFENGSGVSFTGVHVDGGRINLDTVTVEPDARILLDGSRLDTAGSLILTGLRMSNPSVVSVGTASIADGAVFPQNFFGPGVLTAAPFAL